MSTALAGRRTAHQRTLVYITFDFVGHHRWPNAPEEVSYLRSAHRHLFKVRVDVEVTDPDRQIEYHMMKRSILRGWLLDRREVDLGTSSCEMVASNIFNLVAQRYPQVGWIRVEVSEDGENGSIVEGLVEVL